VSSLDLVFAGSSEFAVPSLRSLLAAGHRVRTVLTQPDRPAGRRRRPTPTPLKLSGEELGLVIFEPSTLRDPEAVAKLTALEPDVMVVVDYGLIIPPDVLGIPRLGCINGHASLLPRWRGAAPIERAVLAGDTQTGVTIMRIDEGLDTGDVLLARSTPIDLEENAGQLRERLAVICADALVEVLAALEQGTIEPVPQPVEGVCYASKLDKSEGRIDWQQSADELARVVRAFNPRPGAFSDFRGQRLKVLSAIPLQRLASATPGAVIRAGKDGIDVATGEGVLRITSLQLAGKQPVTAGVFQNGYAVSGVTLGSNGP